MECLSCKKETTNPKFCSRSCSATYTNKKYPKRKTKKVCTICKKPVKSYRHNLCDLHHSEYIQNRFDYIKELPLKDFWGKKSLENLHKSSKSAHIRLLARSNFKHLKEKPCHICGYDKHVELCYIKPISKFDDNSKIGEVNCEENLIQLCPNCHWEFDNGLQTIHK